MKKLCLLAALLFMAGLTFAQETDASQLNSEREVYIIRDVQENSSDEENAVDAQKKKTDVGLGMGLSILGPEIDFELRKNNFDFQSGLGFLTTGSREVYYDDSSSSYDRGYMVFLKEELGLKKNVSTSGSAFGVGACFLSAGITDLKTEFSFAEVVAGYFKYSYTFPFGLELGVKSYLPIFEFLVSKESFYWYSVATPFGLTTHIFAGFVASTIEIKYHF